MFNLLRTISKYIIIFLFLGMFLAPNETLAQVTDYTKMVKVTPVILDINLKPGQEQDYDLKIENLLNQPLGIGLNMETLDATDEVSGMVFGKPHTNSPFVSWISLSEKQFIIAEKEAKTIKVSVKIPKEAKDGSYTSVIFITPFVSKPLDGASPSVVSRVGILALANIGTPKEILIKDMAKILNFNFQSQQNKLKTVVRVQNTFNFNLSTKAKITLSPLIFGKKEIIKLDDKRILAGKTRKWEVPLNLKPGIYQANLAVSIGGGRQIYKNTLLTVPSFYAFIPYLIIVFIVVVIILLRKRLKTALFILYKGS